MRPIAQQLLDRHDHGRVADDPRLTVDDLGQLPERLQTALRAGLRDIAVSPLQLLRRGYLAPLPENLVGVHARVPEIEVRHPAETGHRLPIGLPDHHVDAASLLVAETAVAARHREARHQALHVPLERPRQRLVEIVDAEHQPPIRSRKRTEVRQVRITTQLRMQTRPRHPRQIRRHQVGRTAIERKRRHQHAPITDRHQLRHPRLRLLLQQLHRRRPHRRRLPRRVRRARHLRPRRLAPRHPLSHREMLHPARLTGRTRYLMRI